MFEDFKAQKISQGIIKFLQKKVKAAGFKKVIVPLSGGLDSSTVVFLAVRALGPENVFIAKFPYRGLEQNQDADLVLSQLKIPKPPTGGNVFEIEISEIVEEFLSKIPGIKRLKFRESSLEKIRLGNLMARIRMILLFDLAKKEKALVCGTENKSEYLLGYFTRFGDSASDLEPIRYLYKTQVVRLAHYLGVPEKIIKKPPTAGLWQGQTDEKELGFSYQEADPILYYYADKNYTWEQIVEMGYKKKLVEKVKNQVEKNQFKHEIPKVAIV